MEAPKSMVGPWTRRDVLGQGGNATVWRATRTSDDTLVASKVIDSRKVDEESYIRFVREVQFLRENGTGPGALELLDDGTLCLYLMVLVGPEKTFGTDFHWSPQSPASALVGTVEAERMLDHGVLELAEGVARAVDVFVDRLPDLSGTA
jgi:serine/threonine protein kinase